jgi:hypothetical protein
MTGRTIQKAIEPIRAFAVAAYEIMGGDHFQIPGDGLAEEAETIKRLLKHAIEHADFLLDAAIDEDKPIPYAVVSR